MGRMTKRLSYASVAGLLMLSIALASAPAALAETTTIGFDDLADGTLVTNQYANVDGAGRGVVFNPDTRPGAVSSSTVSPRVRSFAGAASPPRILDTSGCSGEFCQPEVVGRFSDPRSFVALKPGVWQAGGTSQVRLTAYDRNGTELGSAADTVSSSGCNFDAGCALRVDAPGIRYFTISWVSGERRIGIDDLSFERPLSVARSYSLIWDRRLDGNAATVDAIGLRQGFSARTGIIVDRVGGSTGTLTFSASGLPPGVTASFAPASTAGDATTLTLSAAGDAPVFDGSVTVTATASDPSLSGSSPQTTTVPLTVRPNFAIAGDPRFSVPAPVVEVPPCTEAKTDLPVFAPAAFGSPDAGLVPRRFSGTVNVGTPGSPFGVSFSVSPSSVVLDEASRTVTVTVRAASGALSGDTPLTLVASAPPYAASAGSLTLRPVGGTIGSLAPTDVRTPLRLQSGAVVTIHGSGFCPDSVVQFGNDRALGTGVTVSPDGRTLSARVPRLATTGPLTIVSGGVPLRSTTPLTVDSYRNTRALRAPNTTNTATFADLTEAFGADQTTTTISFNPCWPFKCTFKVATVKNSHATQIIDRRPGSGGLCFGFSLQALRLEYGAASLGAFTPAGARMAWQLDGADRPSPSLLRAITVAHLVQFSQQWKGATAAMGGGDGPAIRKRVEAALAAGDGPIISFRAGGQGHAVVAYDVEDDPAAPGAFFIDVYDSNVPHLAAEDRDGKLHAERVQGSRVRVAADGSWSFPNLSWSGNSAALWAIPYGVVKGKLTLSKDLAGIIFSTASPGVKTGEITRDGKPQLDAVGEPTAPAVVRDAPAEPDGPPRDWYILKGGGRWTQSISSPRAISHSVEGRGFTSGLSSRGAAAGRLEMSAGKAALGWTSGGARGAGGGARAAAAGAAANGAPVTLTVSAGRPDAARVASLALGRGRGRASTSVAFTPDRSGVVIRHRGTARTVRLTLGAGGEKLSVPSMRLSGGRTLRVRPISWKSLSRGARAGARRIRGRRPAPAARVVGASVRRVAGDRVSLRIRTAIKRLPKGSTVTLAWAVTAGSKRVVRHVQTLSSPRAGTRTHTFTVARPKGSRLRFVATALAVRAGITPVATTSRRVVTIKR